MTEQEVIEEIKRWTDVLMSAGSKCISKTAEAQDMAIKALEEIQQYREIGTPEECREAVYKQRAKRVGEQFINGYGNRKAECLICHCTVMHPSNYCKFCGQKLDWGDEE